MKPGMESLITSIMDGNFESLDSLLNEDLSQTLTDLLLCIEEPLMTELGVVGIRFTLEVQGFSKTI